MKQIMPLKYITPRCSSADRTAQYSSLGLEQCTVGNLINRSPSDTRLFRGKKRENFHALEDYSPQGRKKKKKKSTDRIALPKQRWNWAGTVNLYFNHKDNL